VGPRRGRPRPISSCGRIRALGQRRRAQAPQTMRLRPSNPFRTRSRTST